MDNRSKAQIVAGTQAVVGQDITKPVSAFAVISDDEIDRVLAQFEKAECDVVNVDGVSAPRLLYRHCY